MPDDFAEIVDLSQLERPPGIGDNSARSLEDVLSEEFSPFRVRRDELLGSASRAPETIRDETTSQRVADLVRLISACRKNAEALRVSRKEPILAHERLIDAVAKRITDPLDQTKSSLEKRLTLYQRQKAEDERRVREAEARRQAEEAARQRREAEEAAAAAATEAELDTAISAEEMARQAEADAVRARRDAEAKAAELSRVRGEYGAVASLKTFWDFADLSRDDIDLETLRPFLPIDAVEKAVRAFIKTGGRELRGVRVFQNTSTSVR